RVGERRRAPRARPRAPRGPPPLTPRRHPRRVTSLHPPMARTWTEVLGDAEGPYETETARQGFVSRLRDSLSRSRRALTEQIAIAAFDPADDSSWERLGEGLPTAHLGGPAKAGVLRRPQAPAEGGGPAEARAPAMPAHLRADA